MPRRELPIAVALIALIVVVSVIQPRFLSESSIQSVLLWLPLIAVCAMGQMLVILTRGIDVSVGSTLALSGMLTAMLLRDHKDLNVFVAAAIGAGIGGGLGAVNGLLIAFARVPAIVATLATLGIYRGLTFVVSGGVQVNDYEIPKALAAWTTTGLFNNKLPWVVLVAALVAFLTHAFLTRTRIGRNLYAIGGNPDAAALRGVPVRPVILLAYVLCGMGAGLAGVLYASRFGNVNPASIGNGFELLVIAAAVIGGTSIFGGVGSATGAFLGCVLLGVINVALAVLQIADTWQTAVYGLVILAAVLFDDATARRLRLNATGEE
ncbi:ABC transporter permease [Armatimonas rosea]|uniref:Autoinducer 2 import system permease protein LsrC n=1 Tax=Armatimonas rosea TaxID=685828 RepID=A0A7W9SQY9_ARMRO|nr:ABC transporter permease [Armatimonas rosea]MBB6050398.1 rhamnose transport system permease protein [Armatimonas rosea]